MLTKFRRGQKVILIPCVNSLLTFRMSMHIIHTKEVLIIKLTARPPASQYSFEHDGTKSLSCHPAHALKFQIASMHRGLLFLGQNKFMLSFISTIQFFGF